MQCIDLKYVCVFTEFTDVLYTTPTPGTKLTLIHDEAFLI